MSTPESSPLYKEDQNEVLISPSRLIELMSVSDDWRETTQNIPLSISENEQIYLNVIRYPSSQILQDQLQGGIGTAPIYEDQYASIPDRNGQLRRTLVQKGTDSLGFELSVYGEISARARITLGDRQFTLVSLRDRNVVSVGTLGKYGVYLGSLFVPVDDLAKLDTIAVKLIQPSTSQNI